MGHRHAVGRILDAEIAIAGVAPQPIRLEILLTQMIDQEFMWLAPFCGGLRGIPRWRPRTFRAFPHGRFLRAHPSINPCHGHYSRFLRRSAPSADPPARTTRPGLP